MRARTPSPPPSLYPLQSDVFRLILAYAPLLTPITTCLPATLVCQLFAPADVPTSWLFLAFWGVPPLLVSLYALNVQEGEARRKKQ